MAAARSLMHGGFTHAAPPSRRPDRLAQPPLMAIAEAVHDADGEAEAATLRRLALRVIERALKDIVAPHCAAADRQTAREFLAGSAMLVHWCSVATLDPGRVTAWAVALDPSARSPLR
jgi:hypothetical protein